MYFKEPYFIFSRILIATK